MNVQGLKGRVRERQTLREIRKYCDVVERYDRQLLKKGNGKATRDIPSGFKQVDDRRGTGGSSKRTRLIESYKG